MSTLTDFEKATRMKLRFSTDKGDLTVEQLWDLPLTHTSEKGVSLDGIAIAANRELQSLATESFVSTATTNPRKGVLELQLSILKRIIAVKIEDNEKARLRAAAASERARLTEILASKEDAALANLSVEAIQQRLAELDSTL